MAKNLMICGNAYSQLQRLNESAGVDRYIMEGVFAGPLDGTKNRNGRIYTVDEYLKHLSYLRDDIRSGELMGCLDHPDIFEVKLKEASHRILDIWYDENTKCVMGKIQLLDTPNGKIAKELVDAGVPLHISSRASGSVNNDGTVSIQQIFTFDIVCKSGFKDAILHRVTESVDTNKYSKGVMGFLTESEKLDRKNIAMKYGFVNEEMSIRETDSPVKLRKEAKKIQENNIHKDNMKSNKINENAIDIEQVKDNCNYILSVELGGDEKIAKLINETSMNNQNVTVIVADGEVWFCYDNPDDFEIPEDIEFEYVKGFDENGNAINPDDIDDENSDENGDGENFEESVKEGDSDDEKTDDENSDDEGDKDENGDDDDDEGVEIVDVWMEGDEEHEKNGDENGDENSDDEGDEDKDEDSTDECNGPGCEGKRCKDKPDPKKDMLTDCKDIKDRREKFDDKFAELVDAVKRKGEKKRTDESTTINKFPISSLLTEGNFKKFMKLNEAQKRKVSDYLKDNGMITPRAVNENWEKGVGYESIGNEAWLTNAPQNYKELYESADANTRRSIRNTAKYVLFENQNDINRFWEDSGLMESSERQLLHEKFINNVPKVQAVNESNYQLPYSKEFIEAAKEMALSYDNL